MRHIFARTGGRRMSLRVQLWSLFVIATALVATLVAVNASSGFDAARRYDNTQVGSETTSQANELAQSVQSVPQQLASILTSRALRTLDSQACIPVLKNLAVLTQAHILIVDHSGNIRCSDGSIGNVVTIGSSPWLNNTFVQGYGLGGPMTDPTTHQVDVAYAATYKTTTGQQVALVGMGAAQAMLGMTSHNNVAPFVVDLTTGKVFGAPADAQSVMGQKFDPKMLLSLAARHATATVKGADGVKRILAAEKIEGTTWVMIAGMPSHVALAIADRDLHR